MDWKVSDVLAKELPLEVTLRELYRQPGKAGYQIRVTLKPAAAVGLLKGEIFLKTNDPASPLVPVLVEANVQPAVTVSPSTLALGTIKVGEALTRRVVVRGNRAFRVTGVDGTGDGVTCDPAPANASPVQILTLHLQLAKPGEFKRQLNIKTDLQDLPAPLNIEATATPAESEPQAEAPKP
jgi:hypothetical protein